MVDADRRVAVVTGSTRGIGLGLARELLARGCAIVVCGRDEAVITRAVDELGDPAHVLGVRCDVSVPAEVQALWDAAVARFGRVDIWINNAGATTTPLPLWEVTDKQVDNVLATNLLGTLWGLQVAVRGMLRQPGGGHIFTVEGLGSNGETQDGVLVYGATKAAVAYARRALLKELKGTEVRLSSIRPGINVTDHLLFGAEVLSPERWEHTKKMFNILGDTPATTTPYLADRVLRARRTGTRIAWLSGPRVAWRFTVAPFRKRDLFAGLTIQRADARDTAQPSSRS